ncbi:MAG TPA: hypothetical protein VFM01_20105, partial [Nakamurella sp.]|nr:hypothetical protein [Nakamurella sp.]
MAGFTAAAVVLGVLVGRSDGYAATSVDADPQDVWVTNPAQYLVGRVNTQIDELDSAALLDGDGYDVLQDGRRVLVVDPDNHRLRALDVATVSLGPPVRLPDRASVALGGDVLAVADRATGAVWVVPADALPAAAIADADPAFRSAPGVAVTAAADGTVAAVAPGARAVLVLPAGGGAPRQVPLAAPAPSESAGRPAAPPAPDGDPRSGDDRQATVTVTMVGDTPVVLDAAAGRLWAAGRSFRLPAGSADPVLQQPGPSAAAVLVATDAALLRVSLADGTVQAFDPGVRGRPAAPVWLRGCAHGAWAGATPSYLRWCGSVPTIRPVPTGPDGTDAGGGSLVFRVNGDTMVLNDVATGNVWVPDDAMVLVNNWQQVAPQRQQSADDAQQPDPGRASRLTLSRTDCSGGMSPPDAADDDLGVRSGRPVVLPVMSNDVVSDCSVTVIDQVSPLPPDLGSVRIVDAGRALQVTTDAAVTGDLPAIHYRISDGAGHSAQATAAVHVVPDDQHPPPAMLRDSAAVVALGGTTTRNVLTDWISPAGDPLFLTGARTDD